MLSLLGSGYALADSTSVSISKVNAQGTSEEVGQISIEETEHGLLFTPDLNSLPGGLHGFHVHEHGSCDPAHKEGEMSAAESAGGHFDPDAKGKHLGPYADGHLGDLPALYVDEQGRGQTPVLAPRLTSVSQLQGRALMIHAGGDNYADEPKPLGGGGSRLACGVI
ncbi:superoxide dismutase [Cu-Zn] SodC2 [Halopseudomonas laoshanensis]|uniref:Superoxide dismutase [Cu-Zn] n=1 Tax=Halopseudomonas laoshanensis TaxID=2268758 RepID=A0A7V7GTZ0_9GAMM|nr:superoxide dismutase family protein [Halopseudomonas laoshanensis]KAA0694321.1 superoxide dismutase [Cu-Zn] SodC2 [Halopseudomonas laoshanensis]